MDEKKPEEIENIFGENIIQDQPQIDMNNTEDIISDIQNVETSNIENVVQNYFTQPTEQPMIVDPVVPLEEVNPVPIAPVKPLEEESNSIIDVAEQNFNSEDANRVTNEHPDAKVILSREKEETVNETVNVADLKEELKDNPSLKFILVLGILLFATIMALPYISNFLK